MEGHLGKSARTIWRRRLAGVGLTGMVAAISIAMVMAPLATATNPPFTGVGKSLSTVWDQDGCGIAKNTKLPFINTTSGVGGFSATASSKNCGSPMPGDSAVAIGQIEIMFPISAPTTGSHSITIIWSTVVNESEKVTFGTCTNNLSVALSYCDQTAQSFVHGKVVLVDLTNGSRTVNSGWPGNFTVSDKNTSCVFGTCKTTTVGTGSGTLVGSFPWSWSLTGISMNKSHTYVLDMFLFGGAVAGFTVWDAKLTGGSASASLNSATLGNTEALKSVTIR